MCSNRGCYRGWTLIPGITQCMHDLCYITILLTFTKTLLIGKGIQIIIFDKVVGTLKT